MRNIARVAATAALVCAAVLGVGAAAQADPIDWPVAPAQAGPIDWPVAPGSAAGPARSAIDWP
ncbi:hypothetical protein ACIF8W_34830 [Streptomyces sp. NPDC085639]|uniref:hypothetical protein n=1 Tax=Streptomyces sp. NPDC085639 TaxID=3365734 RepID=UPI0037CD3D84